MSSLSKNGTLSLRDRDFRKSHKGAGGGSCSIPKIDIADFGLLNRHEIEIRIAI